MVLPIHDVIHIAECFIATLFVYDYRFVSYYRLVILSTVIEVLNAKDDSNKNIYQNDCR